MGRGKSGQWEPSLRAQEVEPEFATPFEVLDPHILTTPLVFSSPHSGRVYPARFLEAARLDSKALRRSEDAFVDELFAPAAGLGVPLLRAHFPRAYTDVNREPYELDPRMFEGRLPSFANTRSLRVAGGLGTIARVVGESQEIYARRLPVEEALRRIEGLYKPYHQTLRNLMRRAAQTFGMAVLIDCHSMPSLSGARKAGEPERVEADMILGDRYGASCSAAIVDLVERELRDLGYQVQRNKPYAGGFITEHYGRPGAGFHALQLEINRALYMDEQALEKTASFAALSHDLRAVARTLTAYLADITGEALPIAAE